MYTKRLSTDPSRMYKYTHTSVVCRHYRWTHARRHANTFERVYTCNHPYNAICSYTYTAACTLTLTHTHAHSKHEEFSTQFLRSYCFISCIGDGCLVMWFAVFKTRINKWKTEKTHTTNKKCPNLENKKSFFLLKWKKGRLMQIRIDVWC